MRYDKIKKNVKKSPEFHFLLDVKAVINAHAYEKKKGKKKNGA